MIATFLIIVVGKSTAAYGIVRLFGYSRSVALTISASLAQIGEFSFILVVLGVNLQILPIEARDLVVAGAILSILVNPFLFLGAERWLEKQASASAMPTDSPNEPSPEPGAEEATTELTGHIILVGYEQVGSRVGSGLRKAGLPFLLVGEDTDRIEALRNDGVEAFSGTSGNRELLSHLNIRGATVLISTLPDPFEAGHIVEHARAIFAQVIEFGVSTPPATSLLKSIYDFQLSFTCLERGKNHKITRLFACYIGLRTNSSYAKFDNCLSAWSE